MIFIIDRAAATIRAPFLGRIEAAEAWAAILSWPSARARFVVETQPPTPAILDSHQREYLTERDDAPVFILSDWVK